MLRLQAYLKASQIGNEYLPFLSFESHLHDDRKRIHGQRVADSLLFTMCMQREMVEAGLDGVEKSNECLSKLMKARFQKLEKMDPSWLIEHNFVQQMAGQLGQQFVADLLGAGLPSDSKMVIVHEVVCGF